MKGGDMNGTEWTDPGQGATVMQLKEAVATINLEGDSYVDATGHLLQIATRVSSDAYMVTGLDWDYRTNLRLTGAPLTAEDLRRIAEAK
jgi:hypothetical protein